MDIQPVRKTKDGKLCVACCPYCGELLAIIPSENNNVVCNTANKILKPEDVVWIIELEKYKEIIHCGDDNLKEVCEICGGCIRFVGKPLCRHPCDGRCGESENVRYVPSSHMPESQCGGPDHSSGDFKSSFQGNDFSGDSQLGDELARSGD